MSLPTDDLIRKALTQTNNLTAIIPKLWASQLEKNLRRNAVLQQLLTENTDLLGSPGDTVYIPSLPDLDAAADLSEGVDINIEALNNANSVPLVPGEKGKAVSITRKALDRMKYDGMAEILDRLADAMSQKIESDIAALYNKSVPGNPTAKLAQVYPGGKAPNTITPDDRMSSDVILDALTVLKDLYNTPWEDCLWRLVITNKQYRDLLKDDKVRNDLRYASPQVMLRGEVGVLHNTRIIVSHHLTELQEGATDAKATTNVALLVAPRWAFIAWKRRPELTVDPTLYDFGRRKQFGVTADYDIQLVHPERALAIHTAV